MMKEKKLKTTVLHCAAQHTGEMAVAQKQIIASLEALVTVAIGLCGVIGVVAFLILCF